MNGEDTPLGARLRRLIARGGPVTVAEFMALALTDPDAGYYATGDPLGAAGDFVTAPEVSQLFGELLGAFLVDLWEKDGAPADARLVELGPGRGTLMVDLLRTARLAPSFLSGPLSGIDLVEASPALKAAQADRLANAPVPVTWHAALPDLPPLPAFVIANEFFDALPVRQFLRHRGRWHERMVGLTPAGELAFVVGPEVPAPDPAAGPPPDGSVAEISPAGEAIMAALAAHVARHGGAVMVIDYGGERPAGEPTLQGVRAHRRADPLAAPGRTDLSAHVDFARLAAAARAQGAAAHGPLPQGTLLVRLGLLERAGRLGADGDAATQESIRAAVERLAAPEAMGTLFKALAITRPGVVPAGFAS